MGFPEVRMRRLRRNATIRALVRRTDLSTEHLVMPLFVRPGEGVVKPIEAMPGQSQYSVDELVKRVRQLSKKGVRTVLLFGIPRKKDEKGTESHAENGIVQEAIRALKGSVPETQIITDVCLCEYTEEGHCGVMSERHGVRDVDNDATIELLVKVAVSQAQAGADVVAPSDMMDGRVGAIRRGLDAAGFSDVAIMSYAAKFASGFYGPFREAAESGSTVVDRRTHQMDPGNAEEALREVALDIEEGADIVIVKPALAYLDIVRRVRERFDVPLAAYNVSGEYSAVKAAVERGWLDERQVVLEMLTGMRRAGADIIITYWAEAIADWLREKQD